MAVPNPRQRARRRILVDLLGASIEHHAPNARP
jgi:hypothetical protein